MARKAVLLAACLEERRTGRRKDGEILSGPEVREAGLVPLLEVAWQLQPVPPPELSPAALAAGLVRVRERLAGREHRVARRSGRLGRFAWAALAFLLALVLAATGTVLAAEGSLPGQLLYPVKRAAESVRLALTPRSQDRATLLMSFAERRLGEVVAVCSAADCPADLLADLDGETAAAAAEIERLTPGERAVLLDRMVALTGHQEEVLVEVLERAPASARPGLERALERSRWGHERARKAREKEKGGPKQEPESPQQPRPKPTKEPHKPQSPAHAPRPKKPAGTQPGSK